MASLTDHLRQPESHGRLPFHSACPICRAERLGGSIVGGTVLGQRAQASILAATVAVSTLGLPSTAIADNDAPTPRTAQTPDGDLDRVDGDDGTQPDTPAAEDDAGFGGENLIEPEPEDGQEAPEPTPLSELSPEQPGDETEAVGDSGPELQTAPVPELAPTPPTPTPPPTVAPAPAVPPSTVGAVEDHGLGESGRPTVHHLRLKIERVRAAIPVGRSTDGPGTPEPTTSPAVERSAPHAAAPRTSVPTGAGDAPVEKSVRNRDVPITGDIYIVRRGDTLWSIARRTLGASASVGTIADEVNRLWELNRDRIATGDPNLLPVGTELEL
jgi:LysM repeat protein